jgi:hypothetical protein
MKREFDIRVIRALSTFDSTMMDLGYAQAISTASWKTMMSLVE